MKRAARSWSESIRSSARYLPSIAGKAGQPLGDRGRGAGDRRAGVHSCRSGPECGKGTTDQEVGYLAGQDTPADGQVRCES